MEETIGYEALFSAEEWDSLDASVWPDPEEGPSGLVHEVHIEELEPSEDQQPFDLRCSICEHIGGADTAEEAKAIARLHESFVAVLVDRTEVK